MHMYVHNIVGTGRDLTAPSTMHMLGAQQIIDMIIMTVSTSGLEENLHVYNTLSDILK